jgi:hypothetical protein
MSKGNPFLAMRLSPQLIDSLREDIRASVPHRI